VTDDGQREIVMGGRLADTGIDVAELQMERLLQAESQGIDGPEESLHGGFANGLDELIDFGNGQDGRELRLLGDAELAERRPFPRVRA